MTSPKASRSHAANIQPAMQDNTHRHTDSKKTSLLGYPSEHTHTHTLSLSSPGIFRLLSPSHFSSSFSSSSSRHSISVECRHWTSFVSLLPTYLPSMEYIYTMYYSYSMIRGTDMRGNHVGQHVSPTSSTAAPGTLIAASSM